MHKSALLVAIPLLGVLLLVLFLLGLLFFVCLFVFLVCLFVFLVCLVFFVFLLGLHTSKQTPTTPVRTKVVRRERTGGERWSSENDSKSCGTQGALRVRSVVLFLASASMELRLR